MTGYVEPPRTGTEAETLLGSLERQRATFAFKCEGLTADQLRHRVGSSQVTLGGLLKHLAHMEDLNFTHLLAGREMPAVWGDLPEGDPGASVWRSAADDPPEALHALWSEAVARSRAVALEAVTTIGPEGTFEVRPGVAVSVRRLLVDLVEEYARHTGHADLIREDVDGRVGEDPPGPVRPYALP